MHVARFPFRPGVGLAWVGVNTVGYAIAMTAWVMFSQPIWPALSGLLGGSVTLALYGTVLGLSSSIFQAVVMQRRGVRADQWIAASTVGFALGFVLACWVSLAVSWAFAPGVNKYLSNTAVNWAFGLLVGACVGGARWLVLRKSRARTIRWVPVSAVCFTVGYGIAVILVLLISLPVSMFGVTTGAITAFMFGATTGAITALIEWLWLGATLLQDHSISAALQSLSEEKQG